MLHAMSFTYNGHSSDDMGVVMVNSGTGLYRDIFLPNRTVREAKINGKDAPYFKGVDNSSLSFPLSFYIAEWKDRNNLRQIARWLFQDYYKPLTFETNPDRIFYAIIEGDSSLLHNGCQDGYITLNVKCNSPYTYSPLLMHELQIVDNLTIKFYNEGDLTIRPQLKITKIGDGDISIKNMQNEQEFKLTGLWNNEVILVNGENEELLSSFQKSNNRYLHNNHNDVWLDFYGESSSDFIFTGNFNCEFYLEYKYLNEDIPIYNDRD